MGTSGRKSYISSDSVLLWAIPPGRGLDNPGVRTASSVLTPLNEMCNRPWRVVFFFFYYYY